MTYDCINAYEDILGNLTDAGDVRQADLDAIQHDDNAAEVANLAIVAINKLRADRAALLAALHTLSANLELWHNAEDDDHENHIIGDCEETIRAAIAQAEQVQS